MNVLSPAKVGLWIACLCLVGGLRATAAETGPFTLTEVADESRIERVEINVKVTGTAEFAIEKGHLLSHPIAAGAALNYRERRLPGAGRDAEALRSLRHYDSLVTSIKVADHATSSRLADDRRLIVAQGRRDGILFYSPLGPLSAADLELLRAPGDSLCLVALLPTKPVAIGEQWSPPGWVAQMLTDTEAASKTELTCTLESVTEGQAKATLKGSVAGATAGSSGKVQLSGSFVFDLKARVLVRADLEQTEERTVGPISPGMKVTAKIVVTRAVVSDSEGLTQEAASSVPLEPPAALTQLRFRSAWNIELTHDRDWHLFQQNERIAVLRLIEQGSLVAQCNLSPVRPAAKGEHVSADQFKKDIKESLGPRMTAIEKAEQIATDDGRFLYRVVVTGEVNQNRLNWIYYLCAAPSGSQMSCVFAVDAALRSRLADRDLTMIKSLKFVDSTATPQSAAKPTADKAASR